MTGDQNIEGVVERIVFENEESGWCVISLEIEGRATKVVGPLTGVRPGETIKIVGRFEHDKRFGEQIRAESWSPVMPATVLGITKYLGSGIVDGIGPVMAERLVGHFGTDTLEVIDKAPQRITEVDGIGPKRREKIVQAWSSMRALHDVMVFLQGLGVSTAHAARIYKKYAQRSIQVVRDNPYRLAIDISGIGFLTADKIAASLGIDRTSPHRADAGTIHVLREMSDEGHVLAPQSELRMRGEKLLEVDGALIDAAVERLASAQALVVEADAVYLAPLHFDEAVAADRLRAIIDTPAKSIDIDVSKAIDWLQQALSIELADEQRRAIERAVHAKVMVITGGPGTGKTTIINGIIRVLDKKNRTIELCAPTGRAAKRLQETTGRPARTIHRLLEFSPKTNSFTKDASDPIAADVLIADEASMIDISLFRSLLDGISDHAQVILVGDIDQLPSVGPGSVLGDIIRSGAVEVVRLDRIFRQADASRIVVNAHHVNAGALPESSTEPTGDFFFIEKADPDDVLETIQTLVAERIPRRFGLDPIDDIQVLTPMHRGNLGAANLNVELQKRLNPVGLAVMRGSRLLRIGDKVMQVRNDYDRDVFNGDLGRVAVINEADKQVSIRFDERLVDYAFADLDELQLAYATSIHKSQGSEYPAVVIPVHTQHYVMLRRNLLYTAITRGRRLVVLVGTTKALRLSVDNDRVESRFTRLAERLRQASE